MFCLGEREKEKAVLYRGGQKDVHVVIPQGSVVACTTKSEGEKSSPEGKKATKKHCIKRNGGGKKGRTSSLKEKVGRGAL